MCETFTGNSPPACPFPLSFFLVEQRVGVFTLFFCRAFSPCIDQVIFYSWLYSVMKLAVKKDFLCLQHCLSSFWIIKLFMQIKNILCSLSFQHGRTLTNRNVGEPWADLLRFGHASQLNESSPINRSYKKYQLPQQVTPGSDISNNRRWFCSYCTNDLRNGQVHHDSLSFCSFLLCRWARTLGWGHEHWWPGEENKHIYYEQCCETSVTHHLTSLGMMYVLNIFYLLREPER